MNDNEKIIELMRLPQSTLIQHDLYLEKEIERLNNVINELEKEIDIAINELYPNELVNGKDLLKNIKIMLQELVEIKR